MKMSEYDSLKNKLDHAGTILSDKYESEIWIEYFNKVIKSECCVYVRPKDSRRKPTPEEIHKAKEDLILYEQKIQMLDLQFAAL